MEKQSIAKGTAVLSFAGIFVKVLSLAYVPILIMLFGNDGYSVYNVAFYVYAFVYILTNSGVPVALSKYVSELRANGHYEDAIRAFKIARFYLIVLGVIFSAALAIFAAPISALMNYPQSYYAILALSPTIFFACVTSAYRGYFQGCSNMTPTAISQIIEQVVRIIVSLPLAIFFLKYGLGISVAAATVGTTVGAISTIVVLWFIYKRASSRNELIPIADIANESSDLQIRPSFKKISLKILEYSVPITICVGMQNFGNIIDIANTKWRLLAAGFDDTVASSLHGYILKSQQLLNVPIAIVIALAIAVLPAISGAMARKDKQSVFDSIHTAFRACFSISLPAAAGFAALSSGIYILFHYGPGADILMFSSILVVLMSVVQIQSSILQGIGKLYSVAFLITAGMLVKILCNYFLVAIPEINIYGAVLGSVIGFSIPLVFANMLIKKHLNLKFSLASFSAKPLISSIIMGSMILPLKSFTKDS